MSCKTTNVELQPQTTYGVEEMAGVKYSIQYCISYRDPALDEWVLARWFWNDDGIWQDDEVWQD